MYLRKENESCKRSKPNIGRHPTSHKYGLELPKSVSHALEMDKRTGTDFWRKAIEKGIRKVFPAFDFVGDDKAVPPGYEFVETYYVFDVKMDLTRKARPVA